MYEMHICMSSSIFKIIMKEDYSHKINTKFEYNFFTVGIIISLFGVLHHYGDLRSDVLQKCILLALSKMSYKRNISKKCKVWICLANHTYKHLLYKYKI